MGDKKLRRRLQRLNRRRRSKDREKRSKAEPAGALPPGEVIETPHGSTYLIQTKYPIDYLHGDQKLSDLLRFTAPLAADVVRQPTLAGTELAHLAFLDTETTGLVGGAGTIAFMVGVGTFVDESFLLRQFFLREPTEEKGMLFALQEVLDTVEGFVTFNGRVFDIPLLEMRYMLGLRQDWPLTAWPQFDLLHPARRLWRHSLPDCTLSTLETRQLGVERTGEDIPGELIPGIYLEYLRTGDTSEIGKVFYHNAVDILTLVVLATQILDRHHDEDPSSLAGSEALAVARWHEREGRYESAENAYRKAVESTNLPVQQDALRLLSALLKKFDRRDEAVPVWETLHRIAPHDPWPCVELAKYHEWHALDLEAAKRWAETAMVSLTHWDADWRRDQAWGDLEHRLSRIVRKLGESQEKSNQ